MDLINGLHGTVATLLICALLFIDEAGVPLPFAPNEALLLIGGLLMAGGAIDPLVFLPLAYVALVSGMFAGYSWARAIGSARLRSIATRLRAERTYDKARDRLRRATRLSLGITRMLPGVRTYATLVAGAAEVPRRTFLAAAMPALLVWELVATGLGALIGVPAERFLTQFEQVVVTGVVLVVAVVASLLAIRHIPSNELQPGRPRSRPPAADRVALALALDIGVVGTLSAGVDRLIRGLAHSTRPSGLVDFAILLAVVVVGYVALTRLGPGRTAGERLFEVSYRAGASRAGVTDE